MARTRPGASRSPKIEVDDAASRARRAHRRRAPHERQRHEDDRPPGLPALALDADQLLDVGAAKLRRLPAEERVRPLEEEQRRVALPHHLRQLRHRRAAPLAPQPQRAGEDAPDRLHHQRLDAVGEARQRQRVLQERVREVEVVDVAERLADVDDGAALGGAPDLLRARFGKRDRAEEAPEEPAQDRPRPLDHRRRVRPVGATPMHELFARDHGPAS